MSANFTRRGARFASNAARLILAVAFAAAAPWAGAGQDKASAPQAVHWQMPAEAAPILQLIYSGDVEAAISAARSMETANAKDPLGYLLEGEARWWEIYCKSLEIKWNFVDAWRAAPDADAKTDLELAAQGVALAEEGLQQDETAGRHLYAAMGYMLRARLLALRGDNRGTAHAGVHAREHLLRAQSLDPGLADADTGLGLYNYYVDTLSSVAKVLRFFMGIPGGDKHEGIRQLENAMEHGELTGVEARFYLARNLRTYDHEYERAAEILAPLTERFPQNPVFTVMLGNMYSLLGRKQDAESNYHAAGAMAVKDPACAARIQEIAKQALAALDASDPQN